MTPSVEQTAEFEACVAQHRAALHAYCYRMLGSLQDAEDALQDALLAAFRGLAGFEGRSKLRSWLYSVTTHACLRLIAARPKRFRAVEYAPASEGVEVASRIDEPIWLEPYPHDPEASFELLESVELAFVAALQHLPGTQRAVLVLREVLDFDAVETAQVLGTSVQSVNSALQRARSTLAVRLPQRSQQATLRDLGDAAAQRLADSFISAWGRADVAALVQLLADDAKFAMPPIPSWFDGRVAIANFFSERVFRTAWRLVPLRASGQLAFACRQGPEFGLGALNVVTLRGEAIAEMTGFLDPRVHAHFSIPDR